MKKSRTTKKQQPDELLLQIAQRLKHLRKEKGYGNYEVFAFDHSIPRSQYGRYEAAASDMRITSLATVLKAMDITLADFFAEGFE